jgi:hypothetical protein
VSSTVQTHRQGNSYASFATALNKLEEALNFTLAKDQMTLSEAAIDQVFNNIVRFRADCRRIKEGIRRIPHNLEQRYNRLMNESRILSPRITPLNANPSRYIETTPRLRSQREYLLARKRQIEKKLESLLPAGNDNQEQSIILLFLAELRGLQK